MNRRDPLWLALRLPSLPLESAARLGNQEYTHDTEQAVVVTHQQRVFQANRAAQTLGITEAMPTLQAQQLAPNLVRLPRQIAQEKNALERLSVDLYQFSPHIQTYSPGTSPSEARSGLLLELSRCLKLFQGLTSLTEAIFEHLKQTPHHWLFGLGHTPMGAWLLSWQGQPVNPGDRAEDYLQRLHCVPITHLYEHPKSVQRLQKMGFVTLGDLWRQMAQAPNLNPPHPPDLNPTKPRVQDAQKSIFALQKRLGKAFCEYLQQIFGDRAVAVPIYHPPAPFCETLEFDYPVDLVEQLLPALQILLQRLSDYLVQRQHCCQSITWQLYATDQHCVSHSIRCQTMHREWAMLLTLSQIHLEHQGLPFAVDAVSLSCDQLLPLQHQTQTLFDTEPHANEEEREILLAKLRVHLGEEGLYQLQSLNDHLPEYSQQTINLGAKPASVTPPPTAPEAPRPTWLFAPPKAIGLRRGKLYWEGELELQQGPERLAGHWWHRPTERDYFIALREDGMRCWVYLDRREGQWFVHGAFA